MPRLGLDRLDRHARLAQPREARVSQLVTGAVAEPGSSSRGSHDLVESRERQRLASVRSFERHEQRVGGRVSRALELAVASHGLEEAGRQRDHSLVAALAVRDEDHALAEPKVTEAQSEHLAATQPAEHHRLGHRAIALGAQRTCEGCHLSGTEDPRQTSHAADQRQPARRSRPRAPRRHAPRDRVDRDRRVAAGHEVAVERGDRGQAALDGGGTQPRGPVDAHHVLRTRTRPTLGGDEAEHDLGGDVFWLAVGHREEHAQVVGVGAHGVGPRPSSHELQELVDQLVADVVLELTARTDTRIERRAPLQLTPPGRLHPGGSPG